jgi:pimeloyl-ACP methyl ester carboxylesterase
MPFFDSNGVRIHYEEHGQGAPVILIHGFGTHARNHWGETGLINFLAQRYHVIAPDCRGHGRSDKPHSGDHYGMKNMCGDVLRLLAHRGIRRTLLVGSSMGSRIALDLIREHPEHFRAAVLSAFGVGGAISEPGQKERIAAALLADDPTSIPHDVPRRFRRGVEAAGNDLKALAACMAVEEALPDFSQIKVKVPVLFLVGTKDRIAGHPGSIMSSFESAELVEIEGGGHVDSASHKHFQEAIACFFATAPA